MPTNMMKTNMLNAAVMQLAFNSIQAPVVPVAPGSKLLGSRYSAGQQIKSVAMGRGQLDKHFI